MRTSVCMFEDLLILFKSHPTKSMISEIYFYVVSVLKEYRIEMFYLLLLIYIKKCPCSEKCRPLFVLKFV